MPKKIRKFEGLDRLENFSDGIFAFCMTLLVMDLKFPPFENATSAMILDALMAQLPKFITFIISFLVIAIVWVNHHHFFYNFKRADWKVMWHNVLLLFWIILIPFTTSFLGDNPTQPVIVAIYSMVMCLAIFSFRLMVSYVFFRSDLLEDSISMAQRKKEYSRIWPGVLAYFLGTILAFVSVYISLVIFVLVPLWYFVPTFIDQEDMMMM